MAARKKKTPTMTEAEWSGDVAPGAMLQFLRERGTDRKFRLFACACWRQRCDGMRSLGDVRRIAAKAELLADGRYEKERGDGDWLLLQRNGFNVAISTSRTVARLRGKGSVPPGEQADILRDVFGNPFRPVAADPSWLSSTVVALAQGMYESRDFSAMPILSDALQDAGCQVADILNHCQDEKVPHVRGCWVIDLVLGKE